MAPSVKYPHRALALLGFLLAMLLAPAAQAQDDRLGDWHGTLATPNGELRLVLTIGRAPDGSLTAQMESLDQAPGQKIPVAQIAIEGGRMTFAIPAIGATYQGEWRADEARFDGTFRQGAQLPLSFSRRAAEARPTVSGLDGVWNGSVTRNGVALRLILRIATGAQGTIALLDSPDLGAMSLPVADLARDGEAVSFAVPVGGVRYRARLAEGGGRMTGNWAAPGSPDNAVTFARSDATAAVRRARPQAPRAPLGYRVEEVRFPNARAPGVTLAGTLTLPEGAGPFPAAILISGSGPQDRDETIFGHKPFAVLADHLTRAGIAVLRYDDRGVGGSSGTHDGATSADFATDANAAFAFLRARPEIDPAGIGYVGHSEGGMIGPLAAMDNGEVAYLVLLAGPGTRTDRLMEAQRRAIGASQGMSEAELDRTAPIQAALFEAAAGDLSDADVQAQLRDLLGENALVSAGVPPMQRDRVIAQAVNPWFRYFARYDPAPVLARIRVPVLALNGSLDRQVVAGENLAGIAAALARNGDVTATELPGLNHLFQTARTGGIGEYADIEETFAPSALDLVSGWINRRFPRRR